MIGLKLRIFIIECANYLHAPGILLGAIFNSKFREKKNCAKPALSTTNSKLYISMIYIWIISVENFLSYIKRLIFCGFSPVCDSAYPNMYRQAYKLKHRTTKPPYYLIANAWWCGKGKSGYLQLSEE